MTGHKQILGMTFFVTKLQVKWLNVCLFVLLDIFTTPLDSFDKGKKRKKKFSKPLWSDQAASDLASSSANVFLYYLYVCR